MLFSLFDDHSFMKLTDFSSIKSHLMTDEELHRGLEYIMNLVYPMIMLSSLKTQKTIAEKFKRIHNILKFQLGSYVMAHIYCIHPAAKVHKSTTDHTSYSLDLMTAHILYSTLEMQFYCATMLQNSANK